MQLSPLYKINTVLVLLLVSLSTYHITGAIRMPPATPRSSSSRSAIFPEARHFVSRENVQYEFSSSVPPVVRVDQGDLVHVQTNDCFHGMVQPDTTSDFNNSSSSSSSSNNTTTTSGGGSFLNGSILNEIPRSKRNPITGPIYVNGARPGDILAVTLLDIRPRGIGIACCGSSAGQLCGWMKKNSTTIKFFDLSRCGTIVTMRDFTDNDTIEGAATITQAPPSRCLQQQQQQQQIITITITIMEPKQKTLTKQKELAAPLWRPDRHCVPPIDESTPCEMLPQRCPAFPCKRPAS
mmetsp:Transcript_28097/g.60441  ORF Transcript_28097/g.60441 Transcript_28097/m.60441 type:complete len:294 (+) Transcript_28097:83-964(+)